MIQLLLGKLGLHSCSWWTELARAITSKHAKRWSARLGMTASLDETLRLRWQNTLRHPRGR